MAARTRTERRADFRGGVNFRDDGADIRPPDLLDALNVIPNGEGGGVKARNGEFVLADLTATAGAARITRMWWMNTVSRLMLQFSDGRLGAINESGGAFQVIHTPGATSTYAIAEGPVNGGQGPVYIIKLSAFAGPAFLQWDGAAGAAAAWTPSAGALPPASNLFIAGNRMWAFGPPPLRLLTDDSRVWWSDLGNPRSWPAANTLQLDPGTQIDQLVGGAAYGSYVFVFKRGKAWVIYDLDTGANRPLAQDVGALSPETIVPTPHGLVFVDPGRGPMITDGSGASLLPEGDKIGRPIWSAFERAVYFGEEIKFTTDLNRAAANSVYTYNMRLKSWWPTNYLSYAMGASEEWVMSSGPTGRKLEALDQNNPVGNGMVELPRFELGDLSVRKRIRGIEVFGLGTLIVTSILDNVTVPAGPPATLPNPTDPGTGRRVPGVGVGNSLAVIVTSDPASFLELEAVAVDYVPRAK